MASLLMDCQVCFDKGHESWKNYFSKWEQLAKHEEHIPESELIDDWNENLKPNKKKKKQPSLLKKAETGSPLTKKKTQMEKKNSKKLNRKKKISQKPNQMTKAEVSEQPKSSGNEILPEQLDNKQLEMNLKAVFMNILEANKNKWEIFSILSQTFSQGRSAIKGSQPPLQNQHLGLTSNDLKLDHMSFSFKSQQFVSVSVPRVHLTVEPVCEPDKSIDGQRFWSNSVCRNLKNSPCLLPTRNSIWPKVNFDGNVFNRFKYSYTNTEHLLWSNNTLTPQQNSKLGSGMESRLVRSCPTSFSNHAAYRRNPPLRPRALEFGTKFPALEYDKKSSHEPIRKENYGRPHTDRGPEGSSSREEKRFQSLCSHKRTNDVCLNKENSNFITPERKSSKRKCFSENILQRKRRRSSKLFFDNEDEDSESDDQTGKSSPLIRWENKKQKSLLTPEAVVVESDSDECESIFDRVKKP